MVQVKLVGMSHCSVVLVWEFVNSLVLAYLLLLTSHILVFSELNVLVQKNIGLALVPIPKTKHDSKVGKTLLSYSCITMRN